VVERLVGVSIADWQDLGFALELDTLGWSRNEWPRDRYVNSHAWVTPEVARFDSTCASWNIEVESACEVSYPGNVRTVNPLSCQCAEIALGDESNELLECVGHECHFLRFIQFDCS